MSAWVGFGFAILGALACALMSVVVKFMGDEQSVWGILLFQSFVGLSLVMPQQFKRTVAPVQKSQWLGLHFLRALSGVGACALSYIAIKFIPLSLEMILASSFPIFVPVFAYFFGQKFDRRLLIYIGLSFVGLWLVVDPRLGSIHPAALLAVGCGVFTALSLVLMNKLLQKGESPSRSVFFYSLFSAVMVGILWGLQAEPTLKQWPLGLVLGFLFYIQQMAFNFACQRLDPVKLSILLYTSLIFTGIFDYFIWQFVPNLPQVLGLLVIAVSSVLSVRLRQRAKQEKEVDEGSMVGESHSEKSVA